MTSRVSTKADAEVAHCLSARQSFAMIAGAGSGKTSSLVEALRGVFNYERRRMLRDEQKAVCITYTKRAVEVIRGRLGQESLFIVSTLHSFLWGEIRYFQESIRESIRTEVLPEQIEKSLKDDNGGKSVKAVNARKRAAELNEALSLIDSVRMFTYGDSQFSNFREGELGHDDVILIACDIIRRSASFRRLFGQKFPFIFVDEAQDTSPNVINAFNLICGGSDLPIVGYFGDPMQQIYEDGSGQLNGPDGFRVITKEENFRSAPEVISTLNAFRSDVRQTAAGNNMHLNGSVLVTLIQSETPEGPRNSYSHDQLERAHQKYSHAIDRWGWRDNHTAKQLFLSRRMIARRRGFLKLHDVFTGQYASSRAQSAYESGEHFLLKPFLGCVIPIVLASAQSDSNEVMRILSTRTESFRPEGKYAKSAIRDVRQIASKCTSKLLEVFSSGSLGDVLQFSRTEGLIRCSDMLREHLDRPPRDSPYDAESDVEDKGDWLVDEFLRIGTSEVKAYCDFLDNNSAFSTQHGVKGEEYDDVVVVFDDVESAWNLYSFSKMLTPETAGIGTPGQIERSRKLAYVCFSRAVKNLRILMFTTHASAAKSELIKRGFFEESQISILADA